MANYTGASTATEYNTSYLPRQLDKREPFKPRSELQQRDGRVDDRTTHRDDYVPHPLGQHYVHEYDVYKRPEGEVEKATSYRTEYTEKPIDRTKAIKRDFGPRETGRFEGEPSYKSDYRPYDITPREKLNHGGVYEPPTVPFQGSSNYSTEFIPRDGKPRSSKKPKETPRDSDQPLQSNTDYRDSYRQHDLPKKYVRERPQWEGNKAPLSDSTNYHSDYAPKDLQKTESYKPNAKPLQSTDPMGRDTTNRLDYKQWPLGERFVHEYPTYEKPAGSMENNTTSHSDYTEKPIRREAAIKPVSDTRVSGKFEDATSYRDEYKPHEGGHRAMPSKKSEYVPNDQRFQGIPTYTTDYIQHGYAQREPFKPVETSRKSNDPFETRTEYKDDYVRHSMPERYRREQPKWTGSTAPLDASSTYTKAYTAKESGRQESFKPNVAPLHSEVPFEDATTFRNDYKTWPVKPIQKHEQPAYVKVDGVMESETTHHSDYTPKPLNKVAAIRPPQGDRELGKFDDHTNYREEYRNWETKGRQKPVPKGEYAPPEARFEGRSNYTDDFVPRPLELTRSMKKNDGGYASNAPFEDATEYKNEFTQKATPRCPAKDVTANSGNYVFHAEDDAGHRYYTSSVPKLPQINGNQHLVAATS